MATKEVSRLAFFGNEYILRDEGAARAEDLQNLSQGNMTPAERTKLEGISKGANVNVIERILLNGNYIAPENKEVSLTIPVKSSIGEGSATVNGGNATASGRDASAFGNATASGLRAVAEGEGAASGINSHAQGENTKAQARNSAAFGSGSEASAEQAFACGEETKATEQGAFACGKYNRPKSGLLFSVGTGTTNERKNAVEVYSDGSVEVENLVGYAKKTYVDQKIQDIIGAAPGTLDTLGEIAAALQAMSGDASGALALQISQLQDNMSNLATKNELQEVEDFHDLTVQQLDTMIASILN